MSDGLGCLTLMRAPTFAALALLGTLVLVTSAKQDAALATSKEGELTERDWSGAALAWGLHSAVLAVPFVQAGGRWTWGADV